MSKLKTPNKLKKTGLKRVWDSPLVDALTALVCGTLAIVNFSFNNLFFATVYTALFLIALIWMMLKLKDE